LASPLPDWGARVGARDRSSELKPSPIISFLHQRGAVKFAARATHHARLTRAASRKTGGGIMNNSAARQQPPRAPGTGTSNKNANKNKRDAGVPPAPRF
jgi:hypothetical protein